MQVLVVASTEMEIKEFRRQYPDADVLVSGVGIAASVYHLLKRIHQVDYDLVIQAGVAGSFDPALGKGQVVQVVSDRFAGEGVSTSQGFHTVFDMGLADPDAFPFRDGWLDNPKALSYDLPYAAVRGITVNTLTDNPEVIAMQQQRFHPSVESMEGASLHYVCLSEALEFIQLRAVSNEVGERDKQRWHLQEAVARLNEAVISVYQKFRS